MTHLAPLFMLMLAVASNAQQLQFRWVDAQGQARSASRSEDIPREAWPAVAVDVHGTDATSGERFRTAEGLTVVIEGIQAPALEDDGTAVSFGGRRARSRLEELVRNSELTLELEGDRRLPDGEYLAHAVRKNGSLLSETLLQEGLVRLCLEESAMRHAKALRAAQSRAKASRAGVWSRARILPAREPELHRGVSLGLFAQTAEFDYSGFLNEIRDVGASHVLIASPWLMEDWRSNESRPVKGRTAGWPALQRVTRQAIERNLRVAYLPLVLLEPGNEDYWRGTIEPSRRWLWFRNYGRLIGPWADIARDLGVSLLSVGSEFSSLERETAAWRAVIANVRSRFDGKLTYSVNWDHLSEIEFWNDLDLAGMTGYHELTKKNDPTVDEIMLAWAPIKDQLLKFQARVKKPILFTEIGYPSQDGANRKPWNYYLYSEEHRRRVPDDAEQADCFRALAQTWRDPPSDFKGLYIWNWWRHEDPKADVGYSVFGKPAYKVLRDYFTELAEREKKRSPPPK